MWIEWLVMLANINEQPIPWWYGPLGDKVSLHVFVDASEAATAANLYAVTEKAGGDGATVALVTVKCRVEVDSKAGAGRGRHGGAAVAECSRAELLEDCRSALMERRQGRSLLVAVPQAALLVIRCQ